MDSNKKDITESVDVENKNPSKTKRVKTAPVKRADSKNSDIKTNSLKSSSSSGSNRQTRTKKKHEWEKYFCYISDKEREAMMQLPNIASKNKLDKKIKSKYRSKSAKPSIKTSVTTSSTFESKHAKTLLKDVKSKEIDKIKNQELQNDSDVESSNQKQNVNEKKQISFKVDVEKRQIDNPNVSPKHRLNLTSSSPKESLSKTNVNELTQLTYALDSLHLKPEYKSLVRSMKANLDQYVRIREYTNKSIMSTADYYRDNRSKIF